MGKFSPLLLVWYIFPVVALVGTNYVVTAFSLQKKWGVKAPDLTVPFLFLGLHFLSVNTFDLSIVPYFLITAILVGIGVAIFQAYFYGEIAYRHYLKMFWRIVFLLTMVLYIAMVVINIFSFA